MNSLRFLLPIMATIALASCSGGGGVSAPSPSGVRQLDAVDASDEPTGSVDIPGHPGCAIRAVFVRLDTEIRGYPLDAAGITKPCERISGSQTQLFERGDIAVSVHGNLHSLSFQANNGLTIHRRYADGNAAPNRAVKVDQDHVALAVDSQINDFVVASQGYAGDNCWLIVYNKQTASTASACDKNVVGIHALATDSADELIVAGSDIRTGASRIDVFAEPASTTSRLVRTIAGPATGLPGLSGTLGYFDISFALATDPLTGGLYVYSHEFNWIGGGTIAGAPPASIAEFAAGANGNVAPLRVLSGSNVGLLDSAAIVNTIGSDDRGNLYVLAPGATAKFAVFGPQAHGNVSPDRTFSDPTAPIGFSGASLGVRSIVR